MEKTQTVDLFGDYLEVVGMRNRATMERSQILYGVTMGDDGVSKVVGLKLEDAVKHTNR